MWAQTHRNAWWAASLPPPALFCLRRVDTARMRRGLLHHGLLLRVFPEGRRSGGVRCVSRGGGCGPARGVATCCGALAVCARAAACLLRMTEGGVCRGAAGAGEGSGGRRASMGACGAAAVSPSGSSTCVLCLGMKRQPPLAGSASMPGAMTSAWRRFIVYLSAHYVRHYFLHCL